jgi:hypothetical protein
MAKGEGGRPREFINLFLPYRHFCCEGFKNNEMHYKGAGERHSVSGILLKESTKARLRSRRERNSITRSAIHQHGLGAKSSGRTFGVRLFHPAT